VVVAPEADHLASGQPLDVPGELRLRNTLPAPAEIEHGLPLARVGERLPAVREAVLARALEDDEDAVLRRVVFALVGPRPVVRASAPTTAFEIAAASSPSGSGRSALMAARPAHALPSAASYEAPSS
jgi:hypothetical protein